MVRQLCFFCPITATSGLHLNEHLTLFLLTWATIFFLLSHLNDMQIVCHHAHFHHFLPLSFSFKFLLYTL